MRPTLAVVSCVWGDYHQYLDRWVASIRAMGPAPDEVWLSSDRPVRLDGVRVLVDPEPEFEFPVAGRLNDCIEAAGCDWVSPFGVDDEYLPDALAGLPSADEADVWQFGYRGIGLADYMPPDLTPELLLNWGGNPTVAPSPFTKRIWHKVGGFRDVAFSDWAFFRDVALAGGRFAHSRKYGFKYHWHHSSSISGAFSNDLHQHLDAARVTELRES
jgi:hypothetical protein